MSLLAVVLAFGLSAFTTTKRFDSPQWYSLTGNDRTMASSYTPSGGTGNDPFCEAEPVEVCAIKADDDGTGQHPLQTDLDNIITLSEEFTEQVEGQLEYKEE